MAVPEKAKRSVNIIALLRQLFSYAAPRGNNRLRARIWAAVLCLLLAKVSNIFTPLIYGKAVDFVNQDDGFSISILLYLLGGYALARLCQQIFA